MSFKFGVFNVYRVWTYSVWTGVVLFLFLFIPAANGQSWTIQTLSQYQSRFTGPNCFNASLVGKGYMEQLRYVDGMEFLFYVENFCQIENKTPMAAGNIIVSFGIDQNFMDGEQSEFVVLHSMIGLGSDQIFEKATAFGTMTPVKNTQGPQGIYEIKRISDSVFSGTSGEQNGVRRRVSYRCVTSEHVRAKIAQLNRDAGAIRINSFHMKFVKSVHEKSVGLNKDEVRKEAEALIKLLASRRGVGEADLYLVGVSRSLLGTVDSYVSENRDKYDEDTHYALLFLKEAIYDLADRIREKTKSKKIHKFLDQTNI